jgi:hypothetical protein
MYDSRIMRALEEVVEFIRALAVTCDGHCGQLPCRTIISRRVRQTGPALLLRHPILLEVLATTSSEQLVEFLVDLALSSKCPETYLSRPEIRQLSGLGFSPRQQLLLGRLRKRIKNNSVA